MLFAPSGVELLFLHLVKRCTCEFAGRRAPPSVRLVVALVVGKSLAQRLFVMAPAIETDHALMLEHLAETAKLEVAVVR
jgi:hypothetical protein